MYTFSPSSCVVRVGVTGTLLGLFTGEENIEKYTFIYCNLEVKIWTSKAKKIVSNLNNQSNEIEHLSS